MKHLVNVIFVAALVHAQHPLVGHWMGTLDTGSARLRLAFHVAVDASGALKTTLDSLDQNARGMVVSETRVQNNFVHFEIPLPRASFEGELSADGRVISGTFTQSKAYPLDLQRVERIDSRPQEPRGPAPYRTEEVSIENASGRLAGSLTIPPGRGPFASVVLVSGSGPQDRDGTIFGHRPFWILADYLSRRGVAVLRLDDRGTGGSAGNSSRQTLDSMATDVLSAVDFLKAHPAVRPGSIGVIGHSEGALVASLAAARDSGVALVVMLAGLGVPGEQVLIAQVEALGRASGLPADTIEQNRRIQTLLFRLLREEDSPAVSSLTERLNQVKTTLPETEQRLLSQPSVQASIERNLAAIVSPEMQSLIRADPAPVLRELKMPVLALNGAKDLQVIPTQNLPAIASALAAGGNTDYTVMTLPGLNHLFQTCQTCQIAEYSTIEETFAPAALNLIGDWIAARVGP